MHHKRISKLEQEIPKLRRKIDRLDGAASFHPVAFAAVPMELAPPPLKGNTEGVPAVYRKRKTYGSGGKQVAAEEWDHPRRLTRTDRNGCILYTVTGENEVKLTITHSDSTVQEWTLRERGEGDHITHAITICYDSEGNPTSIYIHD